MEMEEIMSVKTKKWLHETIEKLSDSDIEKLQKHIESLFVKSILSKKEISNTEGIPNPEPTGKPKKILTAINKSHQVTKEDADALLQSIREGEIPVRFDSVFDKSTGKN